MNLQQLREKRNSVADQMGALAALEADGTVLSDEQQDEFERLSAEFDAIGKQIDRAQKAEEVKAELAKPAPSVGQQQATVGPVGEHFSSQTNRSLIEGINQLGSVAPPAKRSFDCFEEFTAAVYNAKFGHQADQRLEYHESARSAEQRMDTGSKGGFMVPSEFRPEMLKVDPAATPLLAAAKRLPPGVSPDAKVELPALNQDTNQYGGVTVARLNEGGAFTETDANLKLVGWTPDEIGAHIALTEKLIRNWSGSVGFVQGLLRTALNAALEQEAFNGNGGSSFRGILKSGALIKIARNTASDFVFVDVANMVERKLQRGGQAFWLYNQLLLSSLIQMKDGNQNLVWQDNVREGTPNTLMGMPAMPYEFASSVGALGDVVLVQPDPYYVIKDGAGPFLDMGRINTDFTTGRIRVRIFMSNDAGPWLQAPFKLANGTQVSPFVALDVPSS